MAEAYIGEIRIFPYTLIPADWLECDGRLLPISPTYNALFAIIGIHFGGNGKDNFGLPNLNGRAPLGAGAGPGLTARELGNKIGQESLDPMYLSLPQHTHALFGNKNMAQESAGQNRYLARASIKVETKFKQCNGYSQKTEPLVQMYCTALSTFGPSKIELHYNMQPHLALRFCIATQGIYPPRPPEE